MGKRILGEAKFKQGEKLAKQKSITATFSKTLGNEFIAESKRKPKARENVKDCQYYNSEPVEWYWTLLGLLLYATPFIAVYALLFM